MLPSVEVLAMALIVGLYLQDTLLLLYDNEAVLERCGTKGYRAHFGAHSFHLAGRNPFVPNPFTPWRVLFRFAWDIEPLPRQRSLPGAVTPESAQMALRGLHWGMPPIAAGLFIGLPACLYLSLGWVPFLSVVGLMYAGAAVMLVALWRQRARLALRHSVLIGLTFESLVCLPCALNLPRKVSSRMSMSEDLLDAARARLSEPELRRATEHIVSRVDEGLASAEAGSPEWNALTRYRARLMEREA
jgi:hypothetical protein